MSRPPSTPWMHRHESPLPPEYEAFGRWLTGDLHQELTRRIESLGIPPELAVVVAGEAIKAVVGKVERAAEILAAAARASSGGKPSN